MRCSGCGERFGLDGGILIRIVGATNSKKSGLPIPYDEKFPDGEDEKFICFGCARTHYLSEVSGIDEYGYDFPQEEIDEPNMFGLSSPYQEG